MVLVVFGCVPVFYDVCVLWHICELLKGVLFVLFRYSQMSAISVSRKNWVFSQTTKILYPTPLPQINQGIDVKKIEVNCLSYYFER
jgi:hypothetical protein